MNGMGSFIPRLTGRPDSITKRIGIDRLERKSSIWLVVPAQPVVATQSNELIGQ